MYNINMGNELKTKRALTITLGSWPLVTISLTLLLIAKLFTERGASMPWIWVVSPVWLPFAFVIGIFVLWYGILGICFAVCYAIIGICNLIQWIQRKFRRN